MAVAPTATAPPRVRTRAARTTPGATATGILVALSMAVALLLLYGLWEFWPTETILKSTAAQPVHVFGIDRNVSPEVRLLVVVALAGALGGIMHSTRSLAWYVGHQGLKWRWVPFYLVTIVLGAGLASIFYLVLRGGILASRATTADANPYGFTALAALVGLFSEQALMMLRNVASQVFSSAPSGRDSVPEGATLSAQTATASNIGATSATLEGDVTTAGKPIHCHFDYGTSTAYGQTTPDQPSGTSDTHVTANIVGLTPGTEYHFRLVVADDSGQWTTGDDETFTTNGG